jgi:hypothetical protein
VRVPVLAQYVGPIVYRLGRDPFKVERRVRLPLGLCGSSGRRCGSWLQERLGA